MQIKDLGELSGPVLLFGGPYSNLQATQALISEARARGIPATQCICTGDIVAYCADASATLDLIRNFGCPVVAGNMEKSLGAGARDCGCGFEEGTACDLMAGAWFAHADRQMSPDHRAWMASCPDVVVFAHTGKRYAVVHGAPSEIARFVWPTTSSDDLTAEWTLLERECGPLDGIISGHSGIGFTKTLEKGVWINAGVIGMPPHNGAPTTQYGLLTEDGPQIHALSYDCATASDRMTALGLVQGYHAALLSGYWPSEDVLPPELRVPSRARG